MGMLVLLLQKAVLYILLLCKETVWITAHSCVCQGIWWNVLAKSVRVSFV